MAQTLANFHEATINGLAAQLIFANTAMENLYQGELETGGRGCTQKYSSDTTGAQIRVVRPLPLPIEARELGAAINGGNFSAFTHQPKSDDYGLNIITTIDDPVDIPNVNMEMIPVDIARMYVKNISDKVVLNVNAIKIAARFYTCFSAAQVSEDKAYIIKHGSTDDIVNSIISANAKLNKGDKDHGISAFPVGDRIGLINNDIYSALLTTKGVFAIGGANYGYDILRKGGLDAETSTPQLLDNGFLGEIAGVPYHFVSDLVIEVACKYLGLPSGSMDSVLCHISSAYGNLFGLAGGSSIQTIPCPNGQGVRLLPLYRMGAACVIPKSVAWVVDSTKWVNPYRLKEIFTTGITWSYTAPGSRQVLEAKLTAGTQTGKFTPSCDQVVMSASGVPSRVAATDIVGAWVEADCDNLDEFLTAYFAVGANKGSFAGSAFGVEQTLSNVGTGDVVSMVVVDANGTVAAIVKATSV